MSDLKLCTMHYDRLQENDSLFKSHFRSFCIPYITYRTILSIAYPLPAYPAIPGE
jgi:fucose 4-O-acetylase-like acetyltransferase